MIGQLSWHISARTSFLLAIRAMHVGNRLVDKPLEQELGLSLQRFREIDPREWDWEALFDWSFGAECPSFTSQLNRVLGDGERAVGRLYPNLPEELRLRMRPIREQWESRGPGLIASIAENVGYCHAFDRLPRVFLVKPALGGAAIPFPQLNAIVFEAVLANPQPDLPEVLRLAWCVARLMSHELCGSDKWKSSVHEIAAVLPCLAAGESMEVCRLSKALFQVAIETWCAPLPHDFDSDIIWDWWHSLRRPIDWPTSVRQFTQQSADQSAFSDDCQMS
jgi:hypothetical protein